jgi:hypothetical protein
VSVVLIGAKIAAFAVQYVVFRLLITNRLRAVRLIAAQRSFYVGLERADGLYRRPDLP